MEQGSQNINSKPTTRRDQFNERKLDNSTVVVEELSSLHAVYHIILVISYLYSTQNVKM